MDSKGCTRTKKDLVEYVAEATGQSKSAVRRTIQVAFDHIVDELAEGNRLEFREFGVFDAKVRPGRIAQNPKTLQPVHVPARRSVKFKPSRSMRDRLKIECEDAATAEAPTSERIQDALRVEAPVEVLTSASEEGSNGIASPAMAARDSTTIETTVDMTGGARSVSV